MPSLDNVSSIKVFPGIGVARVGNSSEYFIGPETPDVVPDPGDGQYKDSSGALKPQAQRFRVYGFNSQGEVLGEIVSGDTVNGTAIGIQWTVHLTNMKAANYAFQGQYGFDPNDLRNLTLQPGLEPSQRDKLIIDPGVKTIAGLNQGPVQLLDAQGSGSTIFDVQAEAPSGGYKLSGLLKFAPPQTAGPDGMVTVTYSPATVSLGNLYTDAEGRLIVVGGEGRSESCTTPSVLISKITAEPPDPNPEYNGNSYFNNPGWFDDTSGGSIDAALIDPTTQQALFDTQRDALATGWIAVTPPNYSPATNNVVSLLDLQLDLFPEQDPYTGPGPVYYAVTGTDGLPYIASSADGASFDFLPAALSSPSTTLQPALAVFKGKVYYAIVGTDRQPYIASSADGSSFDFQPADPSGPTTALPPALTVFDGKIFYAVVGTDGTPYIASSSDGASFSFQSAASAAQTTSVGPALAAFNGQIFYAVTGSDGRPNLGFSPDGTSFDFQPIAPAGQVTDLAPALTVFSGRLFYAITGTDQRPYIASSSDGASFSFATAAPIGEATQRAPALTAFNGQLFYGITGTDQRPYIAASPDGSSFNFETAAPPGEVTTVAPGLATSEPVNFFRDIYPIFRTVTDYAWTNHRAYHGHRPGSQGDFLRQGYQELLADPTSRGTDARNFVFRFIRPPAMTPSPPVPPPPQPAPADVSTGQPQRGDLMPRLFGNGGSPEENEINQTKFPNQWLSLTDHQLSKFQKWVNGDFETGTPGTPGWEAIPKPRALDFAALQPTVGGGFHPGIELTYLMHEKVFFQGPFRFASGTVPGAIAAYMSVPWQGDFWSCNISWWPAIRPDIVIERGTQDPPVLTPVPWFRSQTIPPNADSISNYEGGYQTMATDWPRFGLVTPVAGTTDQGEQAYQETERDPTLDGPSLLASVADDDIADGNVLTASAAGITVGPLTAGSSLQQWTPLPYSASQAYFFLVGESDGQVLTADFSSGSVQLQARQSPARDSQLWQYVPSGFPGVFFLKSKLTLGVLTANGAGTPVTTTREGSGAVQLWQLDAATVAGP